MRWRTETIDKGMKRGEGSCGSGSEGGEGEVGELTAGMMEVKGVKHKINSALSLIQALPAQIRSVRWGCRGLTCGLLARELRLPLSPLSRPPQSLPCPEAQGVQALKRAPSAPWQPSQCWCYRAWDDCRLVWKRGNERFDSVFFFIVRVCLLVKMSF